MSKLIDATIRLRTKDGVVEYEFVRDSNEDLEWHCTEVTNHQHNSVLIEKIQNLLTEEYP